MNQRKLRNQHVWLICATYNFTYIHTHTHTLYYDNTSLAYLEGERVKFKLSAKFNDSTN